MIRIKIDAGEIKDWETFHDCFSKAFGFPEFYGRNMNAWIDCMSYLNCPEDGMTTVHVEPGKTLILELEKMNSLEQANREIYDAILESAAFVNYRNLDVGEPAVLTLSFYKNGT